LHIEVSSTFEQEGRFINSAEQGINMKVELEIPKEYEKICEKLAKEVNLSKVFSKAFILALRDRLEEEIAFEKLKKIASKSKLTAKDALKLGEELKERVARRHGLL
jgi:hypothetical protein